MLDSTCSLNKCWCNFFQKKACSTFYGKCCSTFCLKNVATLKKYYNIF
jgi:hypothetical protein